MSDLFLLIKQMSLLKPCNLMDITHIHRTAPVTRALCACLISECLQSSGCFQTFGYFNIQIFALLPRPLLGFGQAACVGKAHVLCVCEVSPVCCFHNMCTGCTHANCIMFATSSCDLRTVIGHSNQHYGDMPLATFSKETLCLCNDMHIPVGVC